MGQLDAVQQGEIVQRPEAYGSVVAGRDQHLAGHGDVDGRDRASVVVYFCDL